MSYGSTDIISGQPHAGQKLASFYMLFVAQMGNINYDKQKLS